MEKENEKGTAQLIEFPGSLQILLARYIPTESVSDADRHFSTEEICDAIHEFTGEYISVNVMMKKLKEMGYHYGPVGELRLVWLMKDKAALRA